MMKGGGRMLFSAGKKEEKEEKGEREGQVTGYNLNITDRFFDRK
jgi:hypothetical protein